MTNRTPQEIQTEIDRYYQLVNLYLSLKLFLDNLEETDFEFIGSELKIERKGGHELNPDILLQYNSEPVFGFPVEVKRSLSDDGNVEDELKKMKRYDQELKGFDTDDGEVDDHYAVFCPHYFDKNQVQRILEEKGIEFEDKNFLLWEWNIVQGTKFDDSQEVVSVRLVDGEVDIDDKFIQIIEEEGMKYPLNKTEFVINKEKTLFVRQRPPVAYTIVILWNTVLRSLSKDEFSISDVKKEIQDNYTENLMENKDGNPFQVKKKWIEEAVETMVDLNLVEERGDEDKYKALLGKQIRKNFEQYISEKLGSEEQAEHQELV